MAKSNYIKDLRIYLTSRGRLHSFAGELDGLIKLAEETEESDEPGAEDDDSYGDLIQVSPEELAEAQRQKEEDAEGAIEQIEEAEEGASEESQITDAVRRNTKERNEYFENLSQEHASYLIGDWNEAEFGMPPASNEVVQMIIGNGDLHFRLALFFSHNLDEKYPSIGRKALDKMYVNSQTLGAKIFFNLKLDEKYPNSISSFAQIADLKTIFEILEKYPELNLEEFVTKRLSRAGFDELIGQGIPDKMPEFYADRLLAHIEEAISDSESVRFESNVRNHYISDAIGAIRNHKDVYLKVAETIASKAEDAIAHDLRAPDQSGSAKNQILYTVFQSKIFSVYPELFSKFAKDVHNSSYVGSSREPGFYTIDDPEVAKERLAEISSKRPLLILENYDLIMNPEIAGSAIKHAADLIGADVYDEDGDEGAEEDNYLGLDPADFLHSISVRFSEPDKNGYRVGKAGFIKRKDFEQFYSLHKDNLDRAFERIMLEAEESKVNSYPDRSNILGPIMNYGLDSLYPDRFKNILQKDVDAVSNPASYRSSSFLWQRPDLIKLIRDNYPNMHDEYITSIVKNHPEVFGSSSRSVGRLGGLYEMYPEYKPMLAKALSEPRMLSTRRRDPDSPRRPDYRHFGEIFKIENGDFAEEFSEEARKVALHFSENNPVNFFAHGLEVKYPDIVPLERLLDEKPNYFFNKRQNNLEALSVLYPDRKVNAAVRVLGLESSRSYGSYESPIIRMFGEGHYNLSDNEKSALSRELAAKEVVAGVFNSALNSDYQRTSVPKDMFFKGIWKYFKDESRDYLRALIDKIEAKTAVYKSGSGKVRSHELKEIVSKIKPILYPSGVERSSDNSVYFNQEKASEVRDAYPEIADAAISALAYIPGGLENISEMIRSSIKHSKNLGEDGYIENAYKFRDIIRSFDIGDHGVLKLLMSIAKDPNYNGIAMQRLAPEDDEGRPYIDDRDSGLWKDDFIKPLIAEAQLARAKKDPFSVVKEIGAASREWYGKSSGQTSIMSPEGDLFVRRSLGIPEAEDSLLDDIIIATAEELSNDGLALLFKMYSNLVTGETKTQGEAQNILFSERLADTIGEDGFRELASKNLKSSIAQNPGGTGGRRLRSSFIKYISKTNDHGILDDPEWINATLMGAPEDVIKAFSKHGYSDFITKEVIDRVISKKMDDSSPDEFADYIIDTYSASHTFNRGDDLDAFHRKIVLGLPELEEHLKAAMTHLAEKDPMKLLNIIRNQNPSDSREMVTLVQGGVLHDIREESPSLETIRSRALSTDEDQLRFFDAVRKTNRDFDMFKLVDLFDYPWFPDLYNIAKRNILTSGGNIGSFLSTAPEDYRSILNEKWYSIIAEVPEAITKEHPKYMYRWMEAVEKMKNRVDSHYAKSWARENGLPDEAVEDIKASLDDGVEHFRDYMTFEGFKEARQDSLLKPVLTEHPASGELLPNVWSENLGPGHGDSQEELNWLILTAGSINMAAFVSRELYKKLSEDELKKALDFYTLSDFSRHADRETLDPHVIEYLKKLDVSDEFLKSYLKHLMSEAGKQGKFNYIPLYSLFTMSEDIALGILEYEIELSMMADSRLPPSVKVFFSKIAATSLYADHKGLSEIISYLFDNNILEASQSDTLGDGAILWNANSTVYDELTGNQVPTKEAFMTLDSFVKIFPALAINMPDVISSIRKTPQSLRGFGNLGIAKPIFDGIKNEPIPIAGSGEERALELPNPIRISRSIYQTEQRPEGWTHTRTHGPGQSLGGTNNPRYTLSLNNTNPTKLLYDIGKKLIHAGDGVAHTNLGMSGFTSAWALVSIQDGHFIVEQYQSDYPVFLVQIFNASKSPSKNYQDFADEHGLDSEGVKLEAVKQNESLMRDYPDDYKDGRKHFDYISKVYPYVILANSIRAAMAAGYENIYVLKNAPYYADISNEDKARRLYDEIPNLARGVGLKTIKGEECWEVPATDENIAIYEEKARKAVGGNESYDFSLTPSQNTAIRVEKRKDVGWKPDSDKIKKLDEINLSIKSKLPGVEIPKFFSPIDAIKFLNTQVRGRIFGKGRFNKEFGTIIRDLSTLKKAWDRSDRIVKVSKMHISDSRYGRIKSLNIIINERGSN